MADSRTSSRRIAVGLALCNAVVLLVAAVRFVGGAGGPRLGEPVVQWALAAAFVGLGLLLTLRVPTNRLSWTVALVGTANCLLVLQGVLPRVGAGGVVAGLLGSWVWLVGLGGIATFGLLWFPDGELPGRGWRWVQRGLVAALVTVVVSGLLLPFELTESALAANPIALRGLEGPLLLAYEGAVLLFGLLAPACVAAPLVRYRRADGAQRAQLRWLALAGAVAVGAYVTGDLLTRLPFVTWKLISYGGLALIIASIAVAVLRYRLYDIDRIVSRTVAYALVSLVLAAVYAAIVVTAQAVVGPDDAPDVVVAGATLAVAALFRPLRSRVQAAVDRRFNRSRATGTLVAAVLGERLRSSVDASAVDGALRAAVVTSLAPSHAAVWLAERP